MSGAYDLRILFPTSFSDACFQAGRAIAQLADHCRLSLTIVHIVKRGGATQRVHRELDSFLGEADHYENCRRVLIESDDAPAAVADFSRREPFDLIMSPASDRLGLHSALMPSFRGRLLGATDVPLWTIGSSIAPARFRRPIRRVACLLDFDHHPKTRIRQVTSFAAHFDAQLHVLDVIPPITEGTVLTALDSDRPLTATIARDRMEALFQGARAVETEVGVGHRGRELRRMLERCEADVVFVGQEQAQRGLFFHRFARDLNRLPCPVVCLSSPASRFPQWSFETAAADPFELYRRELVAS